MGRYLLRRLLFIIPTLFGVMLLNFVIVQAAPGGPVERMVAQLKGHGSEATARFGQIGEAGSASATVGGHAPNTHGLPPELMERLNTMYGFDKPAHERFFHMVRDYLHFDFGESFFRSSKVTDLVLEKLPVSISLGLWTTLLVYCISIPLGILKSVRDGSAFDVWSSAVIVIGYAIPSFLFAILLIILFAGGSYWDWFPLRGLTSEHFDQLSTMEKIYDYAWHLVLPVTAMVISGFASLTMLTKNCFLDEISKQYVLTARAKGLGERRVLLGHVFRNAMLVVIAGFPSALLGILFTSNLLMEVIFSLDGLGLLGFEAAMQRDYPVVFGTLFLFTALGLITNILGDMMYVFIDPRIDFEGR